MFEPYGDGGIYPEVARQAIEEVERTGQDDGKAALGARDTDIRKICTEQDLALRLAREEQAMVIASQTNGRSRSRAT